MEYAQLRGQVGLILSKRSAKALTMFTLIRMWPSACTDKSVIDCMELDC